ncbi:MAG: OmpH family outer membrane protein [Bacteroidales bacterium]|nr:OmpH family outer membrane protein [Bacteroidales bacterium]MDD4602968.1 OmpH family outer membrane protein [Bacteroidales bacterium]
MKKIFLTMMVVIGSITLLHAQKFAYVDTQYILDNIPEFAEAQAQLDELSVTWQKEIEGKFAEVDKMYKDYQTQSVLLPDDMKKKKEQEIVDKEKEAKNLQRNRFGKDGDLFKKRQELVKPIQEKIYNAIQEIATNNNYAVIFDKGGSLTMMYANPKYDISDEVLDNMGASLSGRKGKGKAAPAGSGTGGGGNESKEIRKNP